MDTCLCCQLLVNPKIPGFLQFIVEVFKYPFKILKRITDPHLTAVTFIQYIDNEWSHRGYLSVLITVKDWKLLA